MHFPAVISRPMSNPLVHLVAAALLGGLLALAPLVAAPIRFITISSATVPGYVRPTTPEGKPRAESYTFTRGEFFGGNTRHGLLDGTPFEDILKALAPNLAKQNYFPAREAPTADLLIMVHWGVTTVDEDPDKDFQADKLNAALDEYKAAADNGNADPGALNAVLGDQAYQQRGVQRNIARNAALLGYKALLEQERAKPFAGTEEATMSEDLNQERYFVILLAYDYRRMREERKSHLLWSTRISVRAPGNNFVEAMPALAEAGAAVYGRPVAGLLRVHAGEKNGRVELGDLKFIGPVESPKPAEPRK